MKSSKNVQKFNVGLYYSSFDDAVREKVEDTIKRIYLH